MTFWHATWLEREPQLMQFIVPDPDKERRLIITDFWANYLVVSCDPKATEEGKSGSNRNMLWNGRGSSGLNICRGLFCFAMKPKFHAISRNMWHILNKGNMYPTKHRGPSCQPDNCNKCAVTYQAHVFPMGRHSGCVYIHMHTWDSFHCQHSTKRRRQSMQIIVFKWRTLLS